MKKINRFLINGEIVLPHGTESFDLINPTNGQHIGSVVLGDEYDVYLAVEAAKQALKGFSQYGISERIALLRRLKRRCSGQKAGTNRRDGAGVCNIDPLASFGGFKQSGVGREFGVFGLEEYLESKTILV